MIYQVAPNLVDSHDFAYFGHAHLVNYFLGIPFFAQSTHITLALPQAAQLSLFYQKIS